MNIKIDVNLNVTNIEAIISRISKMMDLNRVDSSEIIEEKNIDTISNKSVEVKNNDDINSEEITTDKIRYLLTDLSKVGKYQQVKVILEKYNATKVGQIKPSDYIKIYKELLQLN